MVFVLYTIFPFPEGKKIFHQEKDLDDYLKYLYSIILEVTKHDGIPNMYYSHMEFLYRHVTVLKVNLNLCKKFKKIFQSEPKVKKDVL